NLGRGYVHVLPIDPAAGYRGEFSDHDVGFVPAVSGIVGVRIEALGHPPVVGGQRISTIYLAERIPLVLFLSSVDGDLVGGQSVGADPVDSRRGVWNRHIAVGHLDGLRQFLVHDRRLTQYRGELWLKLGLLVRYVRGGSLEG